MIKYVILSAVFGFTSVLIGAFGAHVAAHHLTESLFKTLQVAIDYHQLYSVILLILSLFNFCQNNELKIKNSIFVFFILGLCLFSGSLYLYVLTTLKIFTFITPVGGVCLMVAWGLLIGHALSRYQLTTQDNGD